MTEIFSAPGQSMLCHPRRKRSRGNFLQAL